MHCTPVIIPTIPIAKRVIFQPDADISESPTITRQPLPINQFRNIVHDTHDKLQNIKGLLVES
jgi:hypothetical protein